MDPHQCKGRWRISRSELSSRESKVKYLLVNIPSNKSRRSLNTQKMSRRRSCSRQSHKSEDKMICINLAGLESLCNADSDSSVNTQGSDGNDYEEGEVEEESYGRGERRGHRGSDTSIEPKRGGGGRYPPMHVHTHGSPQHGGYQKQSEASRYGQRPIGGLIQGGMSQQQMPYQGGGPVLTAGAQPMGTMSQMGAPIAAIQQAPCSPCAAAATHVMQGQQQSPCGQQTQSPCGQQTQSPCGQQQPEQTHDCTNPTRNYSLNVTACNRGLEKMEAQFKKKQSHFEIRCTIVLKTTADNYISDIDNIAKTLKSETEKCIQGSTEENTGGRCYQTTMMMNSAAAAELRKRVGACTIPAWVKQNN